MADVRKLRRSAPPIAVQRAQAAEMLDMSVEHFDRHVKPDLPVVYSGSLRLYPVGALQAWVDAEAVEPSRGRRVA